LPRQGWKTATLDDGVYEKIQKYVDEINYKRGYRRFRSISHFVEEALLWYIANNKERDLRD